MAKVYVCPMHPEVKSDGPGKCPICKMRLVPESGVSARSTDDKGLGPVTFRNYVPLIVVVGIIFLVAAVLSLRDFQTGALSAAATVSYFMAGFFIVFAGFKLMDLKGFAEGYSTYDILASRLFGYGYVYPFIELAFGLLMVFGFAPDWLLWTEFGVMAFSGVGVTNKVLKGEKFKCVCLGTFLKVPLTTVTIIEDFGMALLALVMIFI